MEEEKRIDFACPECGKIYLQKQSSLLGKKAICKYCNKKFTISVLDKYKLSSNSAKEFETPYKFFDSQYFKVLLKKRFINGKTVKDRFYTIAFPDHKNIIRELPALDTKLQSKLMLNKVKSLVEYKIKGLVLTEDKYKFIKSLPDEILKKLAQWDIIEQKVADELFERRKICSVCKKSYIGEGEYCSKLCQQYDKINKTSLTDNSNLILPKCNLCGSQMKHKTISSCNASGIALALLCFGIGVWFTFAGLFCGGPFIGIPLCICALFMGGKRKRVLICTNCGQLLDSI